MISKQTTQIDIDSHHVFTLDCIANVDCMRCETLLSASDEHEDSDVDTIVLVDAAFARNKNNKFRFHECFRKWADESQHVTRVQAVFEMSQTWSIQLKSLDHQRDISRVQLKVDVVSFATQEQQVFNDVVNSSHDRSCNFDVILITNLDIDYHAGKVSVSTVESSDIDRNVVDRFIILQQMKIAKWRETSLNDHYQAINNIRFFDVF